MTLAATFLGGASGRLLPASVPLRFFGAAIAYHFAAWLVQEGITSISLNPDSVIATWQQLAAG